MVEIKRIWNAFKTIAILLSFVINFVLIITIFILLSLIFQIKTGLVQPLVNGLHSSFVGLDEATINTTITVKDTVPVKLNIPYSADTVVRLTEGVPVHVNGASFTLSDGTTLRGAVTLTLPKDLQLPVHLDINVPVDDKLPITLKVPVSIALNQTELHAPFDKLRGLLDPFVRILGNLPDDWGGVWPMVGQILGGHPPNLLASNKYIEHPWPGNTTGAGPVTPGPTKVPSTPGTNVPVPTATIPPPPTEGNTGNQPTTVSPTTEAPTTVSTTPAPPTATPTPENTVEPTLTNTPGPSPTHVEDLGFITLTPTKKP